MRLKNNNNNNNTLVLRGSFNRVLLKFIYFMATKYLFIGQGLCQIRVRDIGG